MSWEAVKLVFDASKSRGAARLTLLAIAEHAGERDAFPGLTRLQRYTRLSRETVVNSIRKLEKLGELKVTRTPGGRHSNVYKIVLSDWSENPTSRPSRPVPDSIATGQGIRLQQSEDLTAAVYPGRPEPEGNPRRTPSRTISTEVALPARGAGRAAKVTNLETDESRDGRGAQGVTVRSEDEVTSLEGARASVNLPRFIYDPDAPHGRRVIA